MADQMTGSDLAAVADRVAVRGPGAEHAVPTHERIAAGRLAEHVAAGDDGSVRRFVNELEHGLGGLAVDPWRLVEELAAAAICRRPGSS